MTTMSNSNVTIGTRGTIIHDSGKRIACEVIGATAQTVLLLDESRLTVRARRVSDRQYKIGRTFTVLLDESTSLVEFARAVAREEDRQPVAVG
jgi:hypothetical protein